MAFCKRGLQETLNIGMEIDKRFHGMTLPSKFKMGIAGCPNKCTDSASVDLGIMGTSKGYHIYVGGNGGVKPRRGDLLLENLQADQLIPVIDKVIEYYKENAKPQERIGRMIDRIGLDELKTKVENVVA
jgi:NAD(P)H-nitrite reductase large subunit